MTRSQKVVLITGASSGFGKAIAEALHARGFCVYATTRAVPAPHNAGSYRSIPMDVDSEVTVAEGVERILREQGRIDVLVNNAGFGVAGAIEDTTVEEARAQLETNFLGTHRLCRAVLPIMRKQRSGRIVNISSLAGLVSVPFQAFYCATKFAVEAYTEALRMEVRPFGIHVSMVEPGDFATGFTAKRRMVRASGPSSPYDARCRAAVGRMAEDELRNADIGPVVRKVVAVVESARPRLRYPVASLLQRTMVALRPALPANWFESLTMDNYKIR
jgi:NAD(P)-dependent dehydrogenase (short-subunit alcohol dehydrogenase family)